MTSVFLIGCSRSRFHSHSIVNPVAETLRGGVSARSRVVDTVSDTDIPDQQFVASIARHWTTAPLRLKPGEERALKPIRYRREYRE
jgi:hypothetical protein